VWITPLDIRWNWATDIWHNIISICQNILQLLIVWNVVIWPQQVQCLLPFTNFDLLFRIIFCPTLPLLEPPRLLLVIQKFTYRKLVKKKKDLQFCIRLLLYCLYKSMQFNHGPLDMKYSSDSTTIAISHWAAFKIASRNGYPLGKLDLSLSKKGLWLRCYKASHKCHTNSLCAPLWLKKSCV
jgi:hypothetical protein